MLTSAKCHETFLDGLLKDPPWRVRLVARLAHGLIKNPDRKTLYVFIPDLHLVSEKKLDNYSYHFNRRENFYRMLFRVQEVRDALRQKGNELEVIQLGDVYDLWRDETRKPNRIIDDYVHILGKLYRYGTGLRGRILIGNHDADMVGARQHYLRLFLPKEDRGAFCLAMHGDWFDPVEKLPDWLKRFGVVMGGKIPQANKYPLGEIRKILRSQAERADGFRDRIRLRTTAGLGKLRGVQHPKTELPRILNVRWTSRKKGKVHPYLASTRKVVHANRNREGASPAWPMVRLVVIGHTHHARISVDDTTDPNHPVALMDCGAWIERYKDQKGDKYPNCQLGVVAGNDIRIYQLDPVD